MGSLARIGKIPGKMLIKIQWNGVRCGGLVDVGLPVFFFSKF